MGRHPQLARAFESDPARSRCPHRYLAVCLCAAGKQQTLASNVPRKNCRGAWPERRTARFLTQPTTRKKAPPKRGQEGTEETSGLQHKNTLRTAVQLLADKKFILFIDYRKSAVGDFSGQYFHMIFCNSLGSLVRVRASSARMRAFWAFWSSVTTQSYLSSGCSPLRIATPLPVREARIT